MKLKTVEITGMHNVQKKTYDINDLTYLFGQNGAGKSTVLQAIQLAILGYIPGTNKTNQAIMSHSNGPDMGVRLTFDSGETLSRCWSQVGSKINTSVEGSVNPEGLLGSMELPVFNFSEFISLTPNKLKDWFIKFLPSKSEEIDWKDEFSEWSEGMRQDQDLINQVLEKIKSFDSDDQITQIQKLNEYLKNLQSNTKAVLQNQESTISTLIRYDDSDIPLDEDSLEKMKKSLNSTITKCEERKVFLKNEKQKYIEAQANDSKIHGMIKMLKEKVNGIDLESEQTKNKRLEEDLGNIKTELDQVSDNLKVLLDEYEKNKFSEKIGEMKAKISELTKIKNSNGICPYTKETCKTISSSMGEVESQIEEINLNIKSTESEFSEYSSKIDELNKKKSELERALTEKRNDIRNSNIRLEEYKEILKSQDSRIKELQVNLVYFEYPEGVPEDIDSELEELETKIQESKSHLVKIDSNIEYNKRIDNLVEDKKKLENQIELLKIWVKKTGENGIQTDVMKIPFKELQKKMDEKIEKIYSKDVSCKFNLTNQANSFSFGLVKNNSYVPFNLLSSGEKTLFTFALLLYIIENSNSNCPIMLIDDMLDHLDASKIEKFFYTVSDVSDVQIVMAGVQPCECSRITTIKID